MVVRPKWTERKGWGRSVDELDYWLMAWDGEDIFDIGLEEHPQVEESVGNWYSDEWTPSDELQEEMAGLTDEEAKEAYEYARGEGAWEGGVRRLGNRYFAWNAHFGGTYHLGRFDDCEPMFPAGDYSVVLTDS